jgi:hypothetical protein
VSKSQGRFEERGLEPMSSQRGTAEEHAQVRAQKAGAHGLAQRQGIRDRDWP